MALVSSFLDQRLSYESFIFLFWMRDEEETSPHRVSYEYAFSIFAMAGHGVVLIPKYR